jgi:hypothetical protein
MSVAVIVAAAVSILSIVAIAVVVYASVPRSVTLLLSADGYKDRTVTVDLGRRKSNGRFDYDRDDRKRVRFVGRSREVQFHGLVPGAWYRVETSTGSGGADVHTMLKTGSHVEIKID